MSQVMETTYPPEAPAGPAGVVAGARDVLDELDSMIWAAKPPTDLLEVVAEL